MAYEITKDEFNILMKNTDLDKLYRVTNREEREYIEHQWFSKATDELRYSSKWSEIDGTETFTVHSEPTEKETKVPSGTMTITVNDWKELQAVIDLIKQVRKEQEDGAQG